jgi:hypothetical protein
MKIKLIIIWMIISLQILNAEEYKKVYFPNVNLGEYFMGDLFFYKAGNHQVNIYSLPEGDSIIAVIEDDSIQELWSEIEVVTRSEKRFYGKIRTSFYLRILKGWINYEDCGVYLLPSPRFPEEANDRIVQIYEQPDVSSHSITILNEEIADLEVPILDISGDEGLGWVKVKCKLKSGTTIVGWTTEFCGNIYGCYGS